MLKEEYKDIPDNEFVPLKEGIESELLGHFKINKLGQILDINSARILSVTPRPKKDYPTVCLRLNGKRYTKRIHKLLALTFLENDDKINKVEVDHIDRRTDNYSLSNLRWVTRKENKLNRVFSENAYKVFKYWISFSDPEYKNLTSIKSEIDCTVEEIKNYKKSYKEKILYDSVYWKSFLTNEPDLWDRFDFPTDWKLIPNSDNSYCSSSGLILLTGRMRSNTITTGYTNHSGYKVVNLNRKLYKVHRLVYSLFSNDTLLENELIDHIDTNRSNNKLENLKKVSSQHENLCNPLTGLKMAKKILKFDTKGNLLKEYDKITDAYTELNVSLNSSGISSCCKGKMKTFKGYIWKYKN